MTCSRSDAGCAPYRLSLKTPCFNDTGKTASSRARSTHAPLPVAADSAARTCAISVDRNRIILYVLFSKSPCSPHATPIFINSSRPLPPVFCYHLPSIPFATLYFALVYLSRRTCKSRCSHPAECTLREWRTEPGSYTTSQRLESLKLQRSHLQ